MLKQWLEKQPQSYWLATAKIFQDALKVEQHVGANSMMVLFYGVRFENVMPLTPVLIPVDETLLSLPAEVINQGIGLTSGVEPTDILKHLQSLLFAAYEGEEVLFRFYDPTVILPMLAAMDESERNQFLGIIHQWVGMAEDKKEHYLVRYSNTFITTDSAQSESWWRIKTHHLSQQENLPLLQRNLESWLWQHFPDEMDAHVTQGNDITLMLMPWLTESDLPLISRVMNAAIVTIAGDELLKDPAIIELINKCQNEEIQYGLHLITHQFQHKG